MRAHLTICRSGRQGNGGRIRGSGRDDSDASCSRGVSSPHNIVAGAEIEIESRALSGSLRDESRQVGRRIQAKAETPSLPLDAGARALRDTIRMSTQSYVSDELTHFVGQAKPNNAERYALFLRILGNRF